ncbi:MAG TPA: hypothetical protein VGQ83_12590 [Polyangia bacterium]|jgi:hemerythrin-like domain-containing protein
MDAVNRMLAGHQLIGLALDALETFVAWLVLPGHDRRRELDRIVALLERLAEVYQRDEEGVLARELIARGYSTTRGELAQLLDQHADCSARLVLLRRAAGAARAWTPAERLRVAATACDYVEGMRRHLAAEDGFLLTAVRDRLGPEVRQRMGRDIAARADDDEQEALTQRVEALLRRYPPVAGPKA